MSAYDDIISMIQATPSERHEFRVLQATLSKASTISCRCNRIATACTLAGVPILTKKECCDIQYQSDQFWRWQSSSIRRCHDFSLTTSQSSLIEKSREHNLRLMSSMPSYGLLDREGVSLVDVDGDIWLGYGESRGRLAIDGNGRVRFGNACE